MEKRRLGESDLYVSPIGLGCRTLGSRAETRKEGVEMVRRAVELGVNFIDTANIYGRGISEEIVGEAVQPMRRQVVLATKGGIVIAGEGRPTQDLRPESIRQAVKESLKRLQTDYIDLYQIHYPDPATPFEETISALREFVETGAIRYVGLSNFSPEELEEYAELMEVPSVQAPYNLLQRKTYRGLLPVCERRGISVIVYTPLLMGLLTGKMTRDTTFVEGDERSVVPRRVVETCIEITERLRPVAERGNRTVAQLVLSYIMNQPGVDCVLVGASSIAQVMENVEAAQRAIPEEDRSAVEKTVESAGANLDEQFFVQAVRKVFTSYAGRRIAVLQMGMKFPVPSEVEAGDRIKISWNGEYLGIAE